jgi:S-DNA-T family DNA segregation ATPase FtsK/SpoIIIE
MMFINSGSDLPETATTALVRALWRYRSELVPIAVAAATFAAANMLHHAHHAAWPWLALATLVGITALAVPPPAWARETWAKLDHPAERAYAVAVTAATGGWLTTATAINPATPPMPAIAVALTIACGIPWWANRRRRAKVRVDRMLDAWPEIANATGLPGSQIMSALVDVWGWRARLRLARGQTINDVITKIPALESGLGTFRGAVRVYPTPDDLANRCELRILDIDPHADAIPWPGPSTTTIMEPIDLGPFEDAAPAASSSSVDTSSSAARPAPARAAVSTS